MIEVGRLCVKTSGRDAGLKCVVVEVLDKNFATIDGQTRRRKCNILHLEPLDQKIKIKPKATHDEVVAEFGDLGIEVREKKRKTPSERPRKARKKKEKPKAEEELGEKVEKAGKPPKEEKPEKKEKQKKKAVKKPKGKAPEKEKKE